MMTTKITGIQLTVNLTQKQVDKLEQKIVYLQRKLKTSFYSVTGIDLVIFYRDDIGKIILDIDQPDLIEDIKKRVSAIIIKHLS